MDSNKKYDESKQGKVVEMIGLGKTFSDACQAVGISRTLEWNTRKENDIYKENVETAKELRTQAVEGKLYDLAMGGNITAVIFYLKTHNSRKYNIALTSYAEDYHRPQVTEIEMV